MRGRHITRHQTMIIITAVITMVLSAGVVLIVVNEGRNNTLITAENHIRENGQEIQALMNQAARGDPRTRRTLDELPQQEISQHCTRTEHEAQAIRAIGRSGIRCQVSLYGNTSQAHAEYLVFMEYRQHSLWDTLRNRMRYPILDAYLLTRSLETVSPEGMLRVGNSRQEPPGHARDHRQETIQPETIRLTHIQQPDE